MEMITCPECKGEDLISLRGEPVICWKCKGMKQIPCDHTSVTVYSKLACRATRHEPAEYDEWAQCDECGAVLDVSDIPEGANETTGDPDYWDVPEWDDRL